MRRVITVVILMLVFGCHSAYGADQKASIAVEWEEEGKFSNIIGKMAVGFSEDENYMEVFVFNGKWDKSTIDVYTHVFEVLEKVQYKEAAYRIKCKNEMGTYYTGTVDLADLRKPKIEINNGTGQVIKNITRRGSRFKLQYIPEVNLGH